MKIAPEIEKRILDSVKSGRRAEVEAAFEELYPEIRDQVLSLCHYLTGNRSDSEDAFQEVLFAVYSGLPRFRGGSSLSTWVYRIAIRVALRLKAKRTHQAMDRLIVEPPAKRAEDPLESTESQEEIRTALSSLPLGHRTVLALFAIDGNSHVEISEILGIPVGTVWSRLHRARQKMASALNHHPAGAG